MDTELKSRQGATILRIDTVDAFNLRIHTVYLSNGDSIGADRTTRDNKRFQRFKHQTDELLDGLGVYQYNALMIHMRLLVHEMDFRIAEMHEQDELANRLANEALAALRAHNENQ